MDIDYAITIHFPMVLTAITLEQPLASYGYTSSNPNAPIFGSNTVAQNGGNPAFAPLLVRPRACAVGACFLASMRSKGRPIRPGLKARDPTWTAQQVFDHSRRNA
jgi:hypothetical protein